MSEWISLIVIAATILIEREVFRRRAEWLGAIGWLPLDLRATVPLGRAADALSAVDAPAGYREAAPMRLDSTRLPPRTEVGLSDDARAIIDLPERVVLVSLRVPRTMWGKGGTQAVARIRVRELGQSLALDGRWLAPPVALPLALVAVYAASPHPWFMACFAVALVAFQHARARRPIREAALLAVAEVERLLQAET